MNALKSVAEAKAVLAGPDGIELAKYALRFAVPAFFGPPPQRDKPFTVNSGTAALVYLNGQSLAVTCHHVLEAYRARRASGEPCLFQLSNCALDPLAQLAGESAELDLAVIGLSPTQTAELRAGKHEFGKHFVEPPAWPPAPVAEGDFVAFGGFPGSLRQVLSFNELNFGSYSSGGAQVTSSSEHHFVCQFDRENWVKCGNEPEPEIIGGLSGCPVFAIRRTHGTDIATYELVGFVYEFSENLELLYVRLARFITADGGIAQ
jgi:hypothetical protein